MDLWTAPMGMYFCLYNEKSNFLIKGNSIFILQNCIHANCTQLSNIAKACKVRISTCPSGFSNKALSLPIVSLLTARTAGMRDVWS